MKYALILAGGSGTRLWPLSRDENPKQLLPFINGRSLLEIAYSRLEGLVAEDQRFVCGGRNYMEQVVSGVPGLKADRYLYEPCGRDTLNALAYSAAIIARRDPDAVMAVFTADHVIEPEADLRKMFNAGFSLVERDPGMLLTFGVQPTYAETGYGYLRLGEPLFQGTSAVEKSPARVVSRFQEKPDKTAAEEYLAAGPEKYLWNSGMFLWKASTFLSCVEKYQPENFQKIDSIAASYGTPEFEGLLGREYQSLPKISVDYAVMEPASGDPEITVAALPLSLSWIDVGSWPSYADVCKKDKFGNAAAAKSLLRDTENCLLVSDDPEHLIAAVGVEDMIIIHTGNATLVCGKEKAQEIKEIRNRVLKEHGEDYV